jgi:hypothetical protein
LRTLAEYFRRRPEPVVLVYYGDHLPSLPLAVYQALIPETEGIGDALIRFNRVPFLIWANETGRNLLNSEVFEASLPKDRTISAHYLGAALLEMLGLDKTDPFLEFLNQLRPEYPVSLESTYRRGGDADFTVFEPDDAPELARYKSWAYYRVMEK